MNFYQLEGQVIKTAGSAKVYIGKLINDPFMVMSGRKDMATGEILSKFGVSMAEARIIQNWKLSRTRL